MSLSTKQLAFAWINSKLEPERINPEAEELEELNGGDLSEKQVEAAQDFINKELAKLKVRFEDYVNKYCK